MPLEDIHSNCKVVESRAILPSGPPPITVPSSLEQENFWSGNSKLRVKHE